MQRGSTGHVWVQQVVVQRSARLRGHPESVLVATAASPEAVTLGCGLTSSYLGSSASFTHPPPHPPAPLMAMAQLKGDISNPDALRDPVHRVAAQARAER